MKFPKTIFEYKPVKKLPGKLAKTSKKKKEAKK